MSSVSKCLQKRNKNIALYEGIVKPQTEMFGAYIFEIGKETR